MNPKDYKLWTALITPMQESGEVDYKTLLKLLKIQEEASNGILILGSTGEALNINEKERYEIVDFTLKQNLKAPIMVGIPGTNLIETKKWVDHLENKIGIHAYLMITPIYAKPGKIGQYNWFKNLLDKSTRPCMLYSVPSRSGIILNFNTVTMLKDHKNFWAIKEASGDINNVKKYVKLAPNIDLFSGDDGMTPLYAKEGAKGLISVSSNVWPKETSKFLELSLKKSLKEEILWEECSDSLFLASNPIPTKKILKELNIIESDVLRAPLHRDDLEDITPIKEAHKKIKEWYKEQQ